MIRLRHRQLSFLAKPAVQYLLLFLVTISWFSYLQLSPTLADPDSFYHAKMALILRDQGAINSFPWLSATTLKYSYVDHHFLYHLLLIPFVSALPPLVGLKAATTIFGTFAILVIFWFLRRLKVRGAFWYGLFLLTVNPFIFRLNLAKAQAVVLILLFLCLYFLFNRKYLSLLAATFFYVWLYAGWPLLLALAALHLFLLKLNYFFIGSLSFIKKIKAKINRQNFSLLFGIIPGVLLGLILSPYFPANINFCWQQFFKIGVVNYQNIIGVGGEWYPYYFKDLFLSAVPFFVVLLIALVLFIRSYKKQPLDSYFFLAVTAILFVFTLKSRRNVEYLVPFGICFAAVAITNFLNAFKTNLPRLKIKENFFVIVLAGLFIPFFFYDGLSVRDSLRQGISFDKFTAPSEWLQKYTQPGSIVFHSDWDEFPILFYHNDHNYYIVGLDPTFMYEYDKKLHQWWVDITTGRLKTDMYQIIKDVFGAEYVFVDINQNASFDQNLADNFNFIKVFENKEARIYQVLK